MNEKRILDLIEIAYWQNNSACECGRRLKPACKNGFAYFGGDAEKGASCRNYEFCKLICELRKEGKLA